MNNKPLKSPWIDLYIVIISTILAIVFILIPPFNQTLLRIPFALVLLLFLPGYVFIAALFPGRDLSGIERFTLSVGLSIAITVFDGFAISITQWRFRPTSIVVSLSLIILFFLIITFVLRRRLPIEQRFVPDIRPLFDSLKTKEEMNDIEKALIFAMVGSIVIASGMLIYAKLTFEEEQFTALYILGPNGKAEGYQTNLTFGVPTSIIVGIENYEHEPVNYTLRIVLGGEDHANRKIRLNHNEKWVENVTFIPHVKGSKLKLEFLLFKEGVPGTYRSVHLWVTSAEDYNQTSGFENYLTIIPQVLNGNMEDENNWTFAARGNVTGNYSDYTYISPTHSYEISLQGRDNGSDIRIGDFGAIYQDFNVSETGLAVLELDVKDSITSNNAGNYLKQVLFNGKVIWEDDVAGHEGWQHVESLVGLSDINRIMLRVSAQNNLQNDGVTVWWDNVQFKTLTTVRIQEWDSNVTFGVPTNITVVVENYEKADSEYDLEIRVEDIPVKTGRIALAARQDWKGEISFIPEVVGPNIRLEARIYKIGAEEETVQEPYRTSEVLITSSIDYDNLDTALAYTISPPEILNGDMESESIWTFLGTNFIGNYTDYTAKSPVLSYGIRKLPNTTSNTGDFGMIYQNVKNAGKGLVMLSFDVKDSITSNTPGYHAKQLLFNDRIVWDDDVAGDEGWQHVEIPIMLIGKNKLAMRVFELEQNSDEVEVWWDNVKFETFGQNDNVDTTSGNVPYIEIRGKILSIKAGQSISINSGNYGNLKSTEELTMYFTENGLVNSGDAVFTTRTSSGNIWYLGKQYRSVDPSKANLLSDIVVNGASKNLKPGDTWELGRGYNLTVRSIYSEQFDDNSALSELELSKNGTIIDSKIFNEGETFVYETDVYGINFKILTFKIDNIDPDSVKITGLYLYSESPIQVNIGDRYGEFIVKEIKDDRIIFKNPNSIRFSKSTGVLDNRIMFKVAMNKELAYTYEIKTKPGIYKIKGDSYSINKGSWINLTGDNFRPFSYDLDTGTSYESLNMYFSRDKYIKPGDAVYTATVKGGKIGFMGDVYYQERDNLLKQVLLDEGETSLRVREPYLLKKGYILSFGDIADNSVLLELTKNGEVVASNIFQEGDTAVFTTTHNGTEFTFFECEITQLIGGVVIIDNIKQYSRIPVVLNIGDRYGEFKVTEISGSRIVLENIDPITIEDKKSILDNWIIFDVSGSRAIPYSEKRL